MSDTFQRILVPVDFSPCSQHALREAFSFAAQVGARLDVLHVWEPSPYVSPTALIYVQGEARSFWEHARTEVQEQLDAFIARARGAATGVVVEGRVDSGYTSNNILATLAAKPYDLVVMGTHGRNWLANMLLGSVAARIVREAPCPVLTVRAPRGDAQAEDAPNPTTADREHDSATPT